MKIIIIYSGSNKTSASYKLIHSKKLDFRVQPLAFKDRKGAMNITLAFLCGVISTLSISDEF